MSVKTVKICPKCLSRNTKKIGKRNEIQRYQCNNCGKNFNPKRPEKLENSLFKEYVYHRQTLQDLANKYNKSIQWVHYKIKEYLPIKKYIIQEQ